MIELPSFTGCKHLGCMLEIGIKAQKSCLYEFRFCFVLNT